MSEGNQQPNLGPLIELTHRRWNIPALAALRRSNGAKFITLLHELGVSRSALSTTLGELIERGLVMKNTGYGHPLRPEYLLTGPGKAVAGHCLELAELLQRRSEEDLAYRKWTLPLVAAIGDGVPRFNALRGSLGVDVTPRAIALGLKSLLAHHWIRRLVVDDYPPAAGYTLLPAGRDVWAHLVPLVSE